MHIKNNKWILLIVLSLIWGSSFILMKRGLVGLNPYQLGSLRIIFATIFLLIVGFKSLAKIPIVKWKFIVFTAFLGTFFPVFLFAYAQTGIKSSVSGILNSLTPLYTMLLGALAFGFSFRRNQIIGVVLGLSGCLILVINGNSANGDTNFFCTILVVIATVCYALNVNLIKKYLSDVSPLSITTGNFAVLLIPAIIILFGSGFTNVIAQATVQHSVLFVMLLGVLGTGVANILYFQLVQITSPLTASSVTYFIPVVAMSWGILDGEMLNPLQFLGAFIILLGVYMATKK
ncbi:DMT family transporter [Flavobacterium psychrophilum]|uniref:DMT family transporter n=1 Tax=Flavobacterium psychrophilum TaxID=96345 RepID=A0A7U2ND39_FLAPS|nr:DMT family transporter [Flavobacterium psychrophilum]EKT3957052.1 DMT family transporter [Flavobacterium psychrophilum]EKT3962863.1 DMT family transporter [Flavobacterium psychrophilum]EKT4500849.1 DMT family transporter [Flavobacterium psychrophilum]EKT4508490.1 DMT family transporter [Flavobacterium psychrophilum]EKT4516438.1 DMT family transporter [Flavobacterium psychrophilum]